MVHTTESATYPWTTVLSGWTGPQNRLETPPSSLLVAGWLQQETAARLFQAGGKDLARLSAEAARARLQGGAARAAASSATVRSAIRRSETANVLGRLPGRGPHAGEAVLIGGHYDHFGIGAPVNGDSIYNGAEDNASGTAAVLAAAEAFVRSGVRPDRSLDLHRVRRGGVRADRLPGTGRSPAGAAPGRGRHPQPRRDEPLRPHHAMSRALGLDQSSLGKAFTAAAAAEGLRVTHNKEALLTRLLLPVGPLLPGPGRRTRDLDRERLELRRAGRRDGVKEQKEKYTDEALPPARRRDAAVVQLWRGGSAAPSHGPDRGGGGQRPLASRSWNPTSEFREAGEAKGRFREVSRPVARICAALPKRVSTVYLCGRLRFAYPGSVSGTAYPAPDSAHLAARKRRGVDPVPHADRSWRPPGTPRPETVEAAHLAVTESKAALAVVKKQKDAGVWGGNLLGLAPSAAQGIKDVGTIPNYRRLLELGWPRAGRPFKLADRVLFRLLIA